METTETVYRRIAGIDVHKKMLAVVVRVERGEQVEYVKRKFGATRARSCTWRHGCGRRESVRW